MNDLYLELGKEFSYMDALKKLNREDIELLTLYSTGGSYFVLRNWIMGSIRKTPKEMADFVSSLASKMEQLLFEKM